MGFVYILPRDINDCSFVRPSQARSKKYLPKERFYKVCRMATPSLPLHVFHIANPKYSLNFLLTSVAVTEDRVYLFFIERILPTELRRFSNDSSGQLSRLGI